MNLRDDGDRELEYRFRAAAAMIPAHGSASDVIDDRTVSVRASSSNPHRRILGYATAAGFVIVVAGLVAITNRHHDSTPTRPALTSVVGTTEAPTTLPVRGEKYATVTTPFGIVELYDSASTNEHCFTLTLTEGPGTAADCFPNESIHDDVAYDFIRERPEKPGLLIGLSDPSSGARIQVGDTAIESDGHGIWVVEVPEGTESFIVQSATGSHTFAIPSSG